MNFKTTTYMKKILIITTALSSFSFGSHNDAQNLIKYLTKHNFSCEQNVCRIENFKLRNEGESYKIKVIDLNFADSNFDFKFDIKNIKEIAKKECKNNTDKTCKSKKMDELTIPAVKELFSNLESIDLKSISHSNKKNPKGSTIDAVHINAEPKLFALAKKDIQDMQVQDFNLGIDIFVKGMQVPDIKEEMLEKLNSLLPSNETTRMMTAEEDKKNQQKDNFSEIKINGKVIRPEKTIKLPTITLINEKFVEMYTKLIKEVVSDKDNMKKDIIVSLETSVNNNNLDFALYAQDISEKGFTGSGLLEFEVSNFEEVLNTLKKVVKQSMSKNNQNAMMPLMGMAKNVNFKLFEIDMQLKNLKEVSNYLKENDTRYEDLSRDIKDLFASKEYITESKNLSELEKFQYEGLLLNHDAGTITIDNPDLTPIMMLVMGIMQGEKPNELLRITKEFK